MWVFSLLRHTSVLAVMPKHFISCKDLIANVILRCLLVSVLNSQAGGRQGREGTAPLMPRNTHGTVNLWAQCDRFKVNVFHNIHPISSQLPRLFQSQTISTVPKIRQHDWIFWPAEEGCCRIVKAELLSWNQWHGFHYHGNIDCPAFLSYKNLVRGCWKRISW